ncbi:MAG TPA: hypothetical protein DCL41_00455 [Bdellovibrionales bacterium]|nr:hypothetical protein [Pseudobdellovibrionaceae bacterium]HAG90307.1 hypothetical protein [Bdellovibrionales bacterium]|tara:strand:+ start:146 stop:505 length:360 start_codon:yes stop_codon:yes gene_type:complete
MLKILLLLTLSISYTGALAEEACKDNLAEQKFTCTYYEFWQDQSMKIEIDFPKGPGCDEAPSSGTISFPSSDKVFTVYEPKATMYLLARGIHLTKITYKKSPEDKEIVETYCIDADYNL